MHFVYATIMLNWNVTDNTKTLTCRMKRKHYKVEGSLTDKNGKNRMPSLGLFVKSKLSVNLDWGPNVELFLLVSCLVALIGIDGGNTTKMSRFANYLRNLLPSNDQVVMQMASKAMGRLAHTGGTFTADYVEFEVKRALEWLGGDRNEGRRHAAVSKFHICWYHI